MKKILISLLTMMLVASCGSLRKGSTRMNESPYADGVKNEGIEVREDQMPAAEKTEEKTKEPEIVVREEKVRSVDVTETTENIHRYYVIIGSFRYLDNARNYKNRLIEEGFVPAILENENGLFRVSVAAYNNEEPARRNIASIRRNYPKYSDVWLLIRKQ
ncbi:SPOR domain-containing protein [Anaerophaga thermohalophila]|uniref:SPOR domain-containing protein n=1 Tax=Anaerophaga thermohalophila TaxID=177400 RepID=UPI0011124861|nr:SPOR domain-containing protein [Anaerophaga thermohalophila]